MRTVLSRQFMCYIALAAVCLSACSSSTAPAPVGIQSIDSLRIPTPGTTLIFSDVEESLRPSTSTVTTTREVTADSTHCRYDIFNNVTWWHSADRGASKFAVNYIDNGVQLQRSESVWITNYWTFSTFDLSPTPGPNHEIFRIDSIWANNSPSKVNVRDSLRSLGVETLKLAGDAIQTVHLQEQTSYCGKSLTGSPSVNQIVIDLWFAPSLGFFVVEDRSDPTYATHSHLELIAYYKP